ncbi:MAG: hypothetical protein CMF22_12125 [Idiomarinaceae bacterium]|nr:hypothetical protein [Idiomarinaceae bacterium]|tara:strand:+ start:1472 stop:1834 length:363 start_codon:yes stop_codon:yes gene_type:complete
MIKMRLIEVDMVNAVNFGYHFKRANTEVVVTENDAYKTARVMVDGVEVFKNEVLKADWKEKIDAENKARYGEDYSPCRTGRQQVSWSHAGHHGFSAVQKRRQHVLLKAYDAQLLNTKMGV